MNAVINIHGNIIKVTKLFAQILSIIKEIPFRYKVAVP